MQTRKLEELRNKKRCEINKILVKKNELNIVNFLVSNEIKKYKKLVFVNADKC